MKVLRKRIFNLSETIPKISLKNFFFESPPEILQFEESLNPLICNRHEKVFFYKSKEKTTTLCLYFFRSLFLCVSFSTLQK